MRFEIRVRLDAHFRMKRQKRVEGGKKGKGGKREEKGGQGRKAGKGARAEGRVFYKACERMREGAGWPGADARGTGPQREDSLRLR